MPTSCPSGMLTPKPESSQIFLPKSVSSGTRPKHHRPCPLKFIIGRAQVYSVSRFPVVRLVVETQPPKLSYREGPSFRWFSDFPIALGCGSGEGQRQRRGPFLLRQQQVPAAAPRALPLQIKKLTQASERASERASRRTSEQASEQIEGKTIIGQEMV